MQADAARRAQADAVAERQRLEAATGIPARYAACDFDNFEARTDDQLRVLAACRHYAGGLAQRRDGAGLILAGSPGTGKTHLLAAIVRVAVAQGWPSTYATTGDLIRGIRDTWRRDAATSPSRVMSSFTGAGLLALDEAGVQVGTAAEQAVLSEVVDGRYRGLRPIVMATDLDQRDLRRSMGARAFDRLAQTCDWLECGWPSHRAGLRRVA